MENIYNTAVAYSGACGILSSAIRDLLLSDDPLPNISTARLIVNHIESNADMPQIMVNLKNDLKEKYKL
jgi:hypothetical protein